MVESEPTPTVGDLTTELIAQSAWRDEDLIAAGIPIVEVAFVTVGGGLGSFVLVDLLRQAGVPTAEIRVLTQLDFPHQTYQHLVRVSQIPDYERLRSDSSSVLDNVWGFPGYAVREAFAARKLKDILQPLWNVFTEPVLSNFYTPRAGQAYTSAERETKRIQWDAMVAKGQVRLVRRSAEGGYFTILTPPAESRSPTRRVAYKSRWVHLGVGYPGVRFLQDLQEYRQKYQDFTRVVNSYEPHEPVYEELIRKPGVVVVRGAGIVASRVLQRLIDDRDNKRAQTTIWHVIRSYVSGPHGPIFARRQGDDGWAFQGFNWPKSAWGGQQRVKLESLDGEPRLELLNSMGGTTTAIRNDWRNQLDRGRRDGFYRVRIGEVEEIAPGQNGTVTTKVRSRDGALLEIPANFIIDATGLEAEVREHRLLADLLDNGGAGLNPMGRLDVSKDFELRGAENGHGKIYASGAMTLGGYYAPVDTFLGLQYSAIHIADDLNRQGFGHRFDTLRSISQWWKWLRNETI